MRLPHLPELVLATPISQMGNLRPKRYRTLSRDSWPVTAEAGLDLRSVSKPLSSASRRPRVLGGLGLAGWGFSPGWPS